MDVGLHVGMIGVPCQLRGGSRGSCGHRVAVVVAGLTAERLMRRAWNVRHTNN